MYRLGSNHPRHREELMPGCSEDIGGGLKPGEQKPSAELCRVALQRMYREATIAGVPFPDFRTLRQDNPVIAEYFIMQDNVKKRVRRAVGAALSKSCAVQSRQPFHAKPAS
ncbi:DUF2235 domain-containing protein [Cronobacter sakazakii]|nr:DUF2235 domain-containing protein [Cronobacter sakazakii]